MRISGLLRAPMLGASLMNHVGPLGVNRLVVPIGISSSQRTSQRTVRLRFRVARGAHTFVAFVTRSSKHGLPLACHCLLILTRGIESCRENDPFRYATAK